jgi:hypothetical protein
MHGGNMVYTSRLDHPGESNRGKTTIDRCVGGSEGSVSQLLSYAVTPSRGGLAVVVGSLYFVC